MNHQVIEINSKASIVIKSTLQVSFTINIAENTDVILDFLRESKTFCTPYASVASVIHLFNIFNERSVFMLKKCLSIIILLCFLLSFAKADNSKVEVQTDFRIQVEADDLSIVKGLDPDVMNILLLGTDARSDTLNSGRTDTMIICSIHKKTGLVQLSSIARDLYVDIPNSSIKDRINAANAYGGPLLAIKTVNEVLGLNIEHYVSINFSSFEHIVDIIEGVDIEISAEEAAEINKESGSPNRASSGLCHMDGKQALAYVRIRKLDNTFGRNNRQRIFLEAVINKVFSEKKLGQMIDLVKICLEYVDYNLDTMNIIKLVSTVMFKGVSIDMYSCPGPSEYTYGSIKGNSVIIGDIDTVRTSLHNFIYGQE